MPAITIDASVVDGSNTHIWPNPIPTIYGPAIINPDSVGQILAPFDISESAVGLISAPINITEQSAGQISIPVNITEQSSGTISVPNSIAANAADPEVPPFALNHARIMYDNLLIGSSISVNTGSNGSYTLIPNTAQRWTFTATGTDYIIFTLPANTDIDTICIGAHNLSTIGASIEMFYDVDATVGGFISMGSKTPTTNNAIMLHVGTSVNARRIKIEINGASGSGYIGSVYAGIALQMQRPFFGGHSPAVLSRQADYFSSNTESGNFIGVEVRRRALQSNADWKNLSDLWYRTYFDPFVVVAETLPFYFAWNLLEYPNDVVYCKNITNISPQYQGQRDLMSVSIPLIGIA